MKTKIYVLWLFCLGMSANQVAAQKLNQQIITDFPASVSSHVYDVISKVSLGNEKQLQLAVLYQHEDSLLKKILTEGANKAGIDKIHAKTAREFANILNTKELDQYYSGIASEQAEIYAKANMNAQYRCLAKDAETDNLYYHCYYAKYFDLIKAQQRYQNTQELNAKLGEVINHHDSIINNLNGKYMFISKSRSKFAEVLRRRAEINLTNRQVDSLLKYEEKVNKKFAKDDLIDFPKYERTTLTQILTEEQHTNYLAMVNKKKASKNASTDWTEILKLRIAAAQDSARLYQGIENYNLARLVATDRYQDNHNVRDKVFKEIDRTLSPTMRELKRARKENGKLVSDTTHAEQYVQKYKGNFKW